MPVLPRLAALTAGSLAALALAVPAATAVPAPGSTAVTSASVASASPASALRKKYKKIRVSYSIAQIKGAYDYTFTVTTKKGQPAPGVRFNLQYQGGIKGQKWSNTGMKYTSDAAGQFHYIGCNISFGQQRMHTNATKKHSQASAKFQVPSC